MSDGIASTLGDNGASTSYPPDAQRTALAHVLGSPAFDVPPRARKFLEYIVEEAVCGRADRIKAYTIAVEVFGREASFDAQADPIVRIEAGRIRRALAHYYLTAGARDPIQITIPKGAYVPVFVAGAMANTRPSPAALETDRRNSLHPVGGMPTSQPNDWSRLVTAVETLAERASSRPNRQPAPLPVAAAKSAYFRHVPRVAIAKFENLDGTESGRLLARSLAVEITGRLSRFKEIAVLSSPDRNSKTLSNTDASYELTGSVIAGANSIHLSVRLVDCTENRIVWTDSFDEVFDADALTKTVNSIAKRVSTAIGDSHGAIFHAEAANIMVTKPTAWDAYQSTLAYYVYQDDVTSEGHAAVRAGLLRTVESFPNYATAWALLSLVCIDEERFAFPTLSDGRPALENALDMARRAIRLDSMNVRGMEAEMLALFLSGETEAALEVGARAREINPDDMHLQAEYGARLALTGAWEMGRDLIAEAVEHNRGHFAFFNMILALCHYMLGSYATARTVLKKVNVLQNPLWQLTAAAIYGQLGAELDAAKARDWVQRNAPDFIEKVRSAAALRIVRKEDQDRILEGLVKAGFRIGEQV